MNTEQEPWQDSGARSPEWDSSLVGGMYAWSPWQVSLGPISLLISIMNSEVVEYVCACVCLCVSGAGSGRGMGRLSHWGTEVWGHHIFHWA